MHVLILDFHLKGHRFTPFLVPCFSTSSHYFMVEWILKRFCFAFFRFVFGGCGVGSQDLTLTSQVLLPPEPLCQHITPGVWDASPEVLANLKYNTNSPLQLRAQPPVTLRRKWNERWSRVSGREGQHRWWDLQRQQQWKGHVRYPAHTGTPGTEVN
jgi:hypothetical protein